jgi:hypothetical protein
MNAMPQGSLFGRIIASLPSGLLGQNVPLRYPEAGRASYDLRLDYKGDPVPPLPTAEAVWADELLRQKGLR